MFPSQDPNMRFEPNRFDRMNSPMGGNGYSYDMNQAQTWNPNAFSSNNHFSPNYAATTRQKPQARGRSALPNAWMDSQQMPAPMPYSGNMAHGSMPPSHRGSDQHDADDDLIPTAIVIKNIPFAVRKEQLVDLMTQMNLPLPYAFNYHFDNGVFRGLAFANFTSADETALVIEHLNHYELQGRKLRVEYKKMLPLQERERIEREKRERRGQLEEQHRTTGHGHQLQTQPSMSSMTSHTRPANTPSPVGMKMEMPDLNDPEVLQFYNQLLVFKEDTTREALIFPASLAPPQRRTVHTIAHHMSLYHNSRGTGEQRQVHVFKNSRPSPPIGTMSSMQGGDAGRRGLNRAATMDVNAPRNGDASLLSNNSSGIGPGPSFGALRGQHSSGLLDIPQSPGGGFASANVNLRSAKSVADLRSYTPSPAPSSASYSQNFTPGVPRFQDFGSSGGGGGSGSGGGGAVTPSMASTGSGHTNPNMTGSGAFGTATMSRTGTNDDGGLSNGFGGLSLRGSMSGGAHGGGGGSASAGPHGPSAGSSNSAANGESPRRIRGMFSWDNHQYHPLSNSTDLGGSGGSGGAGSGNVGSSGPSPISANPGSAGAIGSNRLNGNSAAASFESLRQGAGSSSAGGSAAGAGGDKVGAPLRQPLGPSAAARPGQGSSAATANPNGAAAAKSKDAAQGSLLHVHARHGGSKGSASGAGAGAGPGAGGSAEARAKRSGVEVAVE